MKRVCLYLSILMLSTSFNSGDDNEEIEDFYYILIERSELGEKEKGFTSLKGELSIAKNSLTGLKSLGSTIENCELRIPPGFYKGNIRRKSTKGNVLVGGNNVLADKGDFYLEVRVIDGDLIKGKNHKQISSISDDENTNRTNILFHTGTKAHHSRGCVLAGPRSDSLPESHLLVKLRNFICKDDKMSLPNGHNHNIIIEVRQNQSWNCE